MPVGEGGRIESASSLSDESQFLTLATGHFWICHSERFDGAKIHHVRYSVGRENSQEHAILVKNLDCTGWLRPFDSVFRS